jgi:hypothetical protein
MNRDNDYLLDVPAGFDDSDADSQVHPIACLLLPGATNADAFAAAQQFVSANDVRVVDVAWNYFYGEPEPHSLTLYFTFERDDED